MPFFYSTLYSSIQIESESFPYRIVGDPHRVELYKKKINSSVHLKQGEPLDTLSTVTNSKTQSTFMLTGRDIK